MSSSANAPDGASLHRAGKLLNPHPPECYGDLACRIGEAGVLCFELGGDFFESLDCSMVPLRLGDGSAEVGNDLSCLVGEIGGQCVSTGEFLVQLAEQVVDFFCVHEKEVSLTCPRYA